MSGELTGHGVVLLRLSIDGLGAAEVALDCVTTPQRDDASRVERC